MTGSEQPAPPVLRVVRGEPSPEELAALVVALATVGSAPSDEAPGAGSQWAPPARLLRAPVAPTGWWASALPR